MKKLIIISLSLGLLFGLTSCKPTTQVATAQLPSKPTTTPTQQPAVKPADTNSPVKQTDLNELSEAQGKALEQRQQKKYEPKVPGGKINWMSFEDVEKVIANKPKKVFVEVYTPWCAWCKRLEQGTFADKRVADYMNENYYPIRLNAESPDIIKLGGKEYDNPDFDTSKPKEMRNTKHQLAEKYGVHSFPTILFLNERMDLIETIPGYRKPDSFLLILEQFIQR